MNPAPSQTTPAPNRPPGPETKTPPATAEAWLPYAAIAALAVCLFSLRLAAPPNLLDQDQERPAAYVLDAAKNGNWLCQRDLFGDITSKPPVWTWLSALATLACGRIGVFSLYLPGALAALGTAWLIFCAGRKHFGPRAAFYGALASLLTTAGLKELGLARTDGVFAFTVTATALLAFRAWSLGRGWTWFWLAGAAATLTKGPLGVVLAGGGLLACWWERRGNEPLRLRGSHWTGVGLFLLLTGGWLGLSYWQLGSPVFHKLLGKELGAHAVSTSDGRLPGSLFWQPFLYYLGRAAPWSLLAYYGLWRLWRRPASEASLRRFERFLFCWFAFGLVLFSLAPHQRADLLWPLMPAGALLAGRELERLVQGLRPALFYPVFAGLLAVAMGGFAFYYLGPRGHTKIIQQTIALKTLAAEVERCGGREFPLTHVDAPMTLQIYLNSLRPRVSPKRAAELLRGPEPAFVAANNATARELLGSAEAPPLYWLLPDPRNPGQSPVRVISNRPALEPADSAAFCFGALCFRVHGARLLEATEREFRFSVTGRDAEVLVTNESDAPRKVRLCAGRKETRRAEERVLAGHQTWQAKL